jgi:hypothetical protein
MNGLTRGAVTLLAAGVAGFLIWIATQVDDSSTGGYWAVYGIVAGAGLVMALSQVFGGWTKGGMPRLSLNVFLLAFIPTLIAAGWVVVAHQPHPNWFRTHVLSWSSDIGILNVVRDLTEYVAVLAFGIGLVFGYSFDTAGPPTGATGPARGRRIGRGRRAATTTDSEAPPGPPTTRERAAAAQEDSKPAPRETPEREPAERR